MNALKACRACHHIIFSLYLHFNSNKERIIYKIDAFTLRNHLLSGWLVIWFERTPRNTWTRAKYEWNLVEKIRISSFIITIFFRCTIASTTTLTKTCYCKIILRMLNDIMMMMEQNLKVFLKYKSNKENIIWLN